MEDFKIILGVVTGTFTSLAAFAADWIKAAVDSGLSPSPASMFGYFLVIALLLGSGFVAASFAEMKDRSRTVHFIGGLIIPYVYPVLILFALPRKPLGKKTEEKPASPPSTAYVSDEDSDQINDSDLGTTSMMPAEQTKKLQVKKPKKDAESTQELPAAPAEEVQATPKGGQTTVWLQSIKSATRAEEDARTPSGDETVRMTVTKAQPDIRAATAAMKSSSEAKTATQMLAAAANAALFNPQYFSSISVDPSGNPQGPFMIEMFDGRILEATRIVSPLPDVLVLEIPGGGATPRTIRVPYSKIKTCKLKSEWMGQ